MATINDSKGSQTSLDELCEGLTSNGKFSHLQVFLYRIGSTHKIGQEYLYVSKDAFAKVKLVDLDFVDNHIYIGLQDCSTKMFIHQSIDVADKEFKFLLISWQDLRKMVMDESQSKFNNQDLLEFDY